MIKLFSLASQILTESFHTVTVQLTDTTTSAFCCINKFLRKCDLRDYKLFGSNTDIVSTVDPQLSRHTFLGYPD